MDGCSFANVKETALDHRCKGFPVRRDLKRADMVTKEFFIRPRRDPNPYYCGSSNYTSEPSYHDGPVWPCTHALSRCIRRPPPRKHHRGKMAKLITWTSWPSSSNKGLIWQPCHSLVTLPYRSPRQKDSKKTRRNLSCATPLR